MKIDLKLLQALSAIIEYQNFEKAAEFLCITQSAISQRIKQLEQFTAQPVIVRGQPIEATEVGKKLLTYFQQVAQLEAELLPEVKPSDASRATKVAIATNADSLATWLIPAIKPVVAEYPIEINFVYANENLSHQKIRDGEVFGAIGTSDKALTGCQVTRLGEMKYVLVANPEFKQRYFSSGINRKSLLAAPAASFDQKDQMHGNFIKKHFNIAQGDYRNHIVRSSEAFIELSKQGLAYCMISEFQIKEELEQGTLINILPDKYLTQTFYWHSWVLLKGSHRKLSEAIIDYGNRVLG